MPEINACTLTYISCIFSWVANRLLCNFVWIKKSERYDIVESISTSYLHLPFSHQSRTAFPTCGWSGEQQSIVYYFPWCTEGRILIFRDRSWKTKKKGFIPWPLNNKWNHWAINELPRATFINLDVASWSVNKFLITWMRKLLHCDWSKSEQSDLSLGYLLSVQIRRRVPNYLSHKWVIL